MNEQQRWYNTNFRQIAQGLGGVLILVALVAGGYLLYAQNEKITQLENEQANFQNSLASINSELAKTHENFNRQSEFNDNTNKIIAELGQKIPALRGRGDKTGGDSLPSQWVNLMGSLIWSDQLLKNGGDVYQYKRIIKNLSANNPKFGEYSTLIGELKIETMVSHQLLIDQYLVLIPKIDAIMVSENREHPIISRLYEWIRIRHITNKDVKSLPRSVLINQLLERDQMGDIVPLLKDITTQFAPLQNWQKQAQLRFMVQSVQSLILSELTDIGAN